MSSLYPTISIILCTYNGSKNISAAIESLLEQDYPKDLYEIIVVDDASRDNTWEIINKYNVKGFRHLENKGLSGARNTGLNNATGSIIVTFDDDCEAFPDWLKKIVEPYTEEIVIAVGGMSISRGHNTFMERYLAEVGYGNPPTKDFFKNKNPLHRFITYIKDLLNPVINSRDPIVEVGEIYTMNASFRKSCLLEINGWDEALKSWEDTDLSARLRHKFSNGKILFKKDAKIYHKHRTSISKYLKQIFHRSKDLVLFYKKENKLVPIYPFPIFTVLTTLLAFIFFNPIFAILIIVLLPQILYFWWPLRSFKSLNLELLSYSYVQLSIEISTVLGIIRGLIVDSKE